MLSHPHCFRVSKAHRSGAVSSPGGGRHLSGWGPWGASESLWGALAVFLPLLLAASPQCMTQNCQTWPNAPRGKNPQAEHYWSRRKWSGLFSGSGILYLTGVGCNKYLIGSVVHPGLLIIKTKM